MQIIKTEKYEKLLTILFLSLMTVTTHAQNYLLGDVNRDGDVTAADVVTLVDIILNGYGPFVVSPTDVLIPFSGSATVDIVSGYGQYEVTSANTDIATVTVDGTVITVNAVASGETKVIVKDLLTMRTLEVPVTVDWAPLQLTASQMDLMMRSEGVIEIFLGRDGNEVKLRLALLFPLRRHI